MSVPGSTVISFTNWKPAIDYFTDASSALHEKTCTVFLEIHMEFGLGWEFLEAYEKLAPAIKNRVYICILSTVLSDKDLLYASRHTLINRFIEKPLSAEKLNVILSETTYTT